MTFLENVGRRDFDQGGVCGGFVDPGTKSLNGYERNALYQNLGPGARFHDVGHVEGVDAIEDGRAVVTSDIDNDGDLAALHAATDRLLETLDAT